ncbi:MAG: hypothetical protein HKN82_18840 [Akkermansiaceae bacterium]|nr:hypothetical protein [Akkermansiaceae bacterium]
MLRTALAVLASTVILFVWGSLSWSVFGWHMPKDFKDGEAVAAVLKANCEEHGNYAYPSWSMMNAPAEEQEAAKKTMDQAWKDGPFIYATVRPGALPNYNMGSLMVRQVGIVLLASFTLVFLIQKSKHNAFLDRLSMAVLAGLLLGIMSALPAWNWMELPGRDTVALLLDGIISLTLAGAAIAVILPKRG